MAGKVSNFIRIASKVIGSIIFSGAIIINQGLAAVGLFTIISYLNYKKTNEIVTELFQEKINEFFDFIFS